MNCMVTKRKTVWVQHVLFECKGWRGYWGLCDLEMCSQGLRLEIVWMQYILFCIPSPSLTSCKINCLWMWGMLGLHLGFNSALNCMSPPSFIIWWKQNSYLLGTPIKECGKTKARMKDHTWRKQFQYCKPLLHSLVLRLIKGKVKQSL
jgi:hypothetical protein